MKVLVVDDDELVGKAIGRILRKVGCEVFHASNGEAALTLVVEKRPDLIISDVRMPGMDGATFVQTLRSLNDQTPVVFISGDLGRFEKAVNDLLDSGEAQGLIDKPFLPEKIQNLVQRK